MAKQDVIAFWIKVNEDEKLQRRLRATVRRGSGRRAIVQFARKNGFNFSADDYEVAVATLPRALGVDGYEAQKRVEQLAAELTPRDAKTYSSLLFEDSVLQVGNPLRSILRPFSGMSP
jgi:hypothetical protein